MLFNTYVLQEKRSSIEDTVHRRRLTNNDEDDECIPMIRRQRLNRSQI